MRLHVSAHLYHTVLDPSFGRNQRDQPQQEQPYPINLVTVFDAQPNTPLSALTDRLAQLIEIEWGKPVVIHHLARGEFALPADGGVTDYLRDGDTVRCVTEEEWILHHLDSLRHPWLNERHVHKPEEPHSKWVKIGPHAANRVYVAFGTEEYLRSRPVAIIRKLFLFTARDVLSIQHKRIGELRGADWKVVADWAAVNGVVRGVWTTVQVSGHRCAFQAHLPLEPVNGEFVPKPDDIERKLVPLQLQPPEAREVRVTGTARVGEVLVGSHKYHCSYGDPEGATKFRWLSAASVQGEFEPIEGATGIEYEVRAADERRVLAFEVSAAATDGLVGPPVVSPATAPVAPAVLLPDLPARTSTKGTIERPPVVPLPPTERSTGELVEIEHTQPIRGRDIGMWNNREGELCNEFEIHLKVANSRTEQVNVSATTAQVRQADGSWKDAQVSLDRGSYGETEFSVGPEQIVRFPIKVMVQLGKGPAYRKYNDRRAHHSLPQPLDIRLVMESFRGEQSALVVHQCNEELDIATPPTDRGALHHLVTADDTDELGRHYIAVFRQEPASAKSMEIRVQTDMTRFWEVDAAAVKRWVADAPLLPADGQNRVEKPIIEETEAKAWALVDLSNELVYGLKFWLRSGSAETVDYCRLPFSV